jgi:DNA repair exonuclease SbcCD ATPase subunit
MISFIRNLLGVKTDQAVQGAMEALVRWDPKAATEAELRTMEQHLDGLGRQVAEARASFNQEQKEADEIQALSAQRMAAAEQLQRQAEAETDPARKASLEKSLETIVAMMEQMAPDIEREARDAKDAAEFLTLLEKSYADAGAKLKAARSDLSRAERDMGRAEQQREMAEKQAEAARQAAGLTSSTSGLNVALKAMQDAAARNLADADAAKSKAAMLRPTEPEKEDPNIAAALAAASGKPAPQSLGDRLAALKTKK